MWFTGVYHKITLTNMELLVLLVLLVHNIIYNEIMSFICMNDTYDCKSGEAFNVSSSLSIFRKETCESGEAFKMCLLFAYFLERDM